MTAHGPTKPILFIVYGALMALLALSAWSAYWKIGDMGNLIVALVIAAAKTTLIFLIFMQLRYQRGLVRVFACVGLLWLAIAGILTFSDYLTRNLLFQ